MINTLLICMLLAPTMPDKALHVAGSYVLAETTNKEFALSVGVLKELSDKRFNVGDLLSDIVGVSLKEVKE